MFQIEARNEFLKPGKNGTFYFCILNLNLGSDKKDGTIEMRSIEGESLRKRGIDREKNESVAEREKDKQADRITDRQTE
jgi:hypothetical protein